MPWFLLERIVERVVVVESVRKPNLESPYVKAKKQAPSQQKRTLCRILGAWLGNGVGVLFGSVVGVGALGYVLGWARNVSFVVAHRYLLCTGEYLQIRTSAIASALTWV